MPDGSSAPCVRKDITPPLKWAGGKRWLVGRIAKSLEPFKFNRLIEPFAGSAAVFFHLQPRSAILSDTNSELINTYNCLKRDPEKIIAGLAAHAKNHSSEHYYAVRKAVPYSKYDRAVRFIYLNRTCWNALYRVNLKGEFNVPKGTKNSIFLPSDDFAGASMLLKRASLHSADFVRTIARAGPGDLIFADPPYCSQSANTTFLKYNPSVFTWSDQVRLARALHKARSRGAHIILTNADETELAGLYASEGHVHRLVRQTIISGAAKGRGSTTELVWTTLPLGI